MNLDIEIKIDEKYSGTRVVVYSDKMTREINELLKIFSEDQSKSIVGYKNDMLEILEPRDIIRIYTENKKVLAQTAENTYVLKLRLYELEDILDKDLFVRISNCEIINLKKVKNFDVRFNGTICANLSGNITTYVSRRYVKKIKQILGI